MSANVSFQVLYIQLIICGFFACVLDARNVCISDTGAPISCSVSRHGNTTGKSSSDGQTSDAKVNSRIEGEVMNMGERRRNVKAETKFKPLFLMSKGRARPLQPKPSRPPFAEDINSRPQMERDTQRSNVEERQWSEEGPPGEIRAVMQSRDQGGYEFLDMFKLSDWLSDKRRQKAHRAAASEERQVDSKAEWYASKVQQDVEAAVEGSKVRRQHAVSKVESVSSREEVIRSIIAKAKPVRVKTTIVRKTSFPRAKHSGFKSGAINGNGGDHISAARRPIAYLKTLSAAAPSASVISGTRPNASSLIPKKINTDSKDLSSSKTLSSNRKKVQSKISGPSHDDSGFLGRILNSIFRREEMIKTPEELAIEEVDRLVAAERDAENDLMDKLDVSDKKSKQREQSTKKDETPTVKNHPEDAKNGSVIKKNDLSGANNISISDKHAAIMKPSESSNVREEVVDVSKPGTGFGSKRKGLSVSIILGQKNILDYLLGRKENPPPNETDASPSHRSDSYNGMNGQAEILSVGPLDKEIPGRVGEMSLKAKGNIQLERKDIQLKTTAAPEQAENIAETTSDIPAKGTSIIPAKDSISTSLKAMEVHDITEQNELKEKDFGIQGTESSSDVQNTATSIRTTGKAAPMKLNDILDILVKAKDIPAGEGDIPTDATETLSTAKDIRVKQDLDKQATDMPAKAEDISVSQEEERDSLKGTNGLTAKTEDISVKQVNLPRKANDMPVKAKDISIRNENDMPLKADGIPIKQHLSEAEDDMPAKAVDIQAKPQDIPIRLVNTGQSKTANDVPYKAGEQKLPYNPRGMQVPAAQPSVADVFPSDILNEDEKSDSDREEVNKAMFSEMGNIMDDLDKLGTLWERLQPSMRLKNSHAMRKVLHAVADVFGLGNKDSNEQPISSSGKAEDNPGQTEVEGLRYDVAVESEKGGKTQKAFKDLSPRGQQERIGLRRSRRSLDGLNRRRRVLPAASNRKSRRHRNSAEAAGRKQKRLADTLNRQGGQNEKDEEEELVVVNEEVDKKKRNTKRRDYEDYIFGNNPGYILSRQRRVAEPQQIAQAPTSGPAEPAPVSVSPGPASEEDKAEEDAISRELANLLIEKVYNRVMKSLKTVQKTETELTTAKPADTEDEVEEEERRWILKHGQDLKRHKRAVDVTNYCITLKTKPFNFTDADGTVTDLYTEAVNTGVCVDYEMSLMVARDTEAKESTALEGNEVEKDERDAEKQMVENGMWKLGKEAVERRTDVEVVQKKARRQAGEEVGGEVKSESDRVIRKDVETDTKGETQILAKEEAKREVDNIEVERFGDRKIREEVNRKTQEEEEEEQEQEQEAHDEAKRRAEEREEEEEEEEEKETENDLDAKDRENTRREVRDNDPSNEQYSAANDIIRFGGDNWDMREEEFGGVRRSADEEQVGEKAEKEVKSRRRSRVQDKIERDVDDLLNYMNSLKSGKAKEKTFEGQE